MTVTASLCLFLKKNGPIMLLDQNLHQRVTRFGCVGFSMYACGFSVPQMRLFYLFTYPPRSKWASCENIVFSATIDIFCKSIAGPLPSIVQAYIQLYSFGGRIKLIICQISHELIVTIHEISTSWTKNSEMSDPVYHICYKMATDFVENFQAKNLYFQSQFLNSISLYKCLYCWLYILRDLRTFLWIWYGTHIVYILKLAPKQDTLFRRILLNSSVKSIFCYMSTPNVTLLKYKNNILLSYNPV